MKVSITKVREVIKEVLITRGYQDEHIDFITQMYLGGEMRGHTSHGLASFPGFAKKHYDANQVPKIISETSALFYIDANSNQGVTVGKLAADEAIKRAQEQAVGTAMIKNMESWLRPGAIAEYIADQGFVALVFNNGGEASIAPPGGYDPVIGTNPTAFGLPIENGSLVVDMATSKRAKGQIRLANKQGTKLPPGSFYDNQGKITIEPEDAYSLIPFGDHKGFALAMFIEILCGSLVGMPMMLEGDPSNRSYGGKTPQRGGFILVIDPSKTTDLETFKRANQELITKIKATHSIEGKEIRIPGEKAGNDAERKKLNDLIEIDDQLWEDILDLAGKS